MPNLTTKQQLTWAAETLKSSNIEDPELEAEVLLAHILKVDRARLLTLCNEELKNEKTEKLKNYVERRAKREPLQYITGIAHFMSLEFEVTPEVLIPRPETELVVEAVIRLARNQKPVTRNQDLLTTDYLPCRQAGRLPITILDIGTGSGCIAVSLAHYFPEVTVLGIDIDEKVLRVAKRNAKKHGVSDRCKFKVSSIIYQFLNFSISNFDFILSNPPYIPTADIPKLQPEVQFEPKIALDGGADGLDYYRRIIPAARKYLKDKGCLVLEMGEGQSPQIKDLLAQNKYREIKIFKDYDGVERVVVGKSHRKTF